MGRWAAVRDGKALFSGGLRNQFALADLKMDRLLDTFDEWATGFRPDYSWLDVPVLDRKGHLRHDGGVVDAPGLYAIGLPFLRRRKSSFIHGAEDDARDLIDHLAGYLAAD